MSTNNKVTLLGYYGGDEPHCLSAWQSTALELESIPADVSERIHYLFEQTVSTKQKSPAELLKMLADNHHGTPFEKSMLHFQVRADVATHIQFLKHRIATSINSESARYKELDDKWYSPDEWHSTPCDITTEAIHQLVDTDFAFTWGDVLEQYALMGHRLYHAACIHLSPVLGRKRAKESARYFLPYSKQLDFDVAFNFRSFMHFQSLRNSIHAQKEIRELAQDMLTLVQDIPGNPFQYSLEAFGYGGNNDD